jgi:hypothetical protein
MWYLLCSFSFSKEAHPMATRRVSPPWEFLRDASKPSLESYELSRLNNAANLRREITALLDQWIEDNSQALLARWVRDRRSLPLSEGVPCEELPQQELPFGDSPETVPPETESHRVARILRNASVPR